MQKTYISKRNVINTKIRQQHDTNLLNFEPCKNIVYFLSLSIHLYLSTYTYAYDVNKQICSLRQTDGETVMSNTKLLT